MKVEPVAGVAVNVTRLPVGKLALQVLPQFMPLGALVTVPDPDPFFSTVRVDMGTGTTAVKVVVTVWSAFMTTVQIGPSRMQPAPLQLVNVEPSEGTTLSVTVAPLSKSVSQIDPHEIPLGSLLTVPVPVPALATCK
jgi:3D (Asp-Asp-Asp) domain-containing protein